MAELILLLQSPSAMLVQCGASVTRGNTRKYRSLVLVTRWMLCAESNLSVGEDVWFAEAIALKCVQYVSKSVASSEHEQVMIMRQLKGATCTVTASLSSAGRRHTTGNITTLAMSVNS